MDTEFFKWVWRFNALVLATAVTLMLCVFVWEMTSSLRRSLFQPQTTNTLITLTIQTDETEDQDQPNPAEVRRYFSAPLEYSAVSPYALPCGLSRNMTTEVSANCPSATPSISGLSTRKHRPADGCFQKGITSSLTAGLLPFANRPNPSRTSA